MWRSEIEEAMPRSSMFLICMKFILNNKISYSVSPALTVNFLQNQIDNKKNLLINILMGGLG